MGLGGLCMGFFCFGFELDIIVRLGGHLIIIEKSFFPRGYKMNILRMYVFELEKKYIFPLKNV